MKDRKNLQTASEEKFDESLIKNIGSVVNNSAEYAKSRLALAAVEAKVATFSVVTMLIMAAFALILLCGAWGLACFAIAHWLMVAGYMTMIQSVLTVAVVNVVLLIVVLLFIGSLAGSIQFDNSLKS